MIHRLILLFAGHFLCDFPLQGDFLAKGKNPYVPLPGVPWQWCMLAHTAIHAGMVYLVTRNPWLALAEIVIHWATDDMKCAGWFGFTVDQCVHLACKSAWAVIG
jgi:hypothetical protein